MNPDTDDLREFFDVTRAAEAAARWPLLGTLWMAMGGEALASHESRGTRLHVPAPRYPDALPGREAEVKSATTTAPVPSPCAAESGVLAEGDPEVVPRPTQSPAPSSSSAPSLEDLFNRLR